MQTQIKGLYIERYLPLVWNKEIDLLIICNNTEPLLLRELMKIGQKNIFVLNQQCMEINELIEKNKQLYDGLKLLDNKLNQIRKKIASPFLSHLK